jgi:lipoprotein-anchoring transpeptidase ErfK/SrfK
MAKKIKRKRRTAAKPKRTLGRYLRFYFLALFSAFTVYIIGGIFMKAPVPCANSGTCQSDRKVQINNNAIGMFDGRAVIPPKIYPSTMTTTNVLGASTSPGAKHIYVDLTSQRLYAYQGDTQVMATFISSGKWDPTPVGNFHIWEKLVATRMAGGSGADAYDLPNVPWVMYFYQDYGLHGAYWHNNFGHPMSHGCVNMRIVDAKALYNWADGPTGNTPGTPVSVCNSFTPPDNCVQNNPVSD